MNGIRGIKMISLQAFKQWIEHAPVGDETVYYTGLTHTLPHKLGSRVMEAYDEQKVELFQRRSAISRTSLDKKGAINIIWMYDYLAVRVSPKTSRKLHFCAHGYNREDIQ